MVAWFLIAIATLTVFAYIAVSGVQNVATTSDAVGRVETVRRLDAVAAALTAKADYGNGGTTTKYLLAGAPNGAGLGYGLPAELAVQGVTPFGQKFVYCPFGDASVVDGTPLTVTSANGSSYTVGYKTFNGKNYVVGGRPAYPQLSVQADLMGWVLAPRSKLSAIPSCDQVTYNTSTTKFEVPDGIVRPVFRTVQATGGTGPATAVEIDNVVKYVSTTAAASGTGDTIGDPMTLANALNYYRTKLPLKMTIAFAAGTYNGVGNNLNVTTNYQAYDGMLYLTSSSGNVGEVTLDTGGMPIRIPGTLSLFGITFGTADYIIVDPGRNLIMRWSSVGRINNMGGSVSTFDNNWLTGTTSAYGYHGEASSRLLLGNSVLHVSVGASTGSAVNGLQITSSSVEGNGATININAGKATHQYGIFVNSGSSFVCSACTVNVNVGTTYGFYVLGRLSLLSSVVRNGTGVTGNSFIAISGPASHLEMVSTQVMNTGARSNYAINDLGGGTVSGSGGTVYMGAFSSCWNGPLFYTSFNSAGQTSAVAADGGLPAMSGGTAATKDEVRNYVIARDDNNKKYHARNHNTSSWMCAA